MTSFILLEWMNEIRSPLSSFSSESGMSARFSSNWNIYKKKDMLGDIVERTVEHSQTKLIELIALFLFLLHKKVMFGLNSCF